ncbi:helix-turn-helix domain-containing protein [Rhizobium lusitanum]|uniref:Helix-turn-helix domain-containing protein n=1 Tax=Rhizobium lusitanum TaxID=293958 RepID=A0A6L9UAD9_9HYPH|nr:AraC family transcriptional regulator [Rhizobium lusitanum]NEI72261.1 helix-turn-helix domain-containing protein [Rhizobium lusitanum]
MTELQNIQNPPRKLVSIEEIIDIKTRRPIATTRGRGWDGVTVDLYRPRPDCSQTYPALDHHLICYCPSGRARLIQRRDGAVHEGIMSAGISLLMPAGCESTWEGPTATSARLRIPTALVAAAGEQFGRHSVPQIEIRNIFETRDTLIEHMALVLLSELQQKPHPAQALIIDHVSAALAAHLLRKYNAFEAIEPDRLPRLSKMEVDRLADYIQDNLDRMIGLGELAEIVNVSRFHFARIFKQSTGMTAMTFVEQCRINKAQSLISETDVSLAEVALITGFADQSHFTRRFRRLIGSTPAAFAREHGRRFKRRLPN